MTALTCAEFVELATSFLEDALDSGAERRFVEHISTCGGCEGFLDQFRQTIHLLGAP
jgi:hypothetical protein